MKYTAYIIKEGKWYAGFIKELPGVNTQGKTIEELRENLKEAIQLILESNEKHLLEEFSGVEYTKEALVV